MLYQIYSIDDYSRHKAVYEGVSWGAIFTGSLLLLTLPVFLPLGGRWQRFRDWMGSTVQDPISRYVVALLNVLFCFFFMVLYFRVSAVHEYDNTKWEFDVGYNETLHLPAFAFAAGDYNDAALVQVIGHQSKCNFPVYNSPACPEYAFNTTAQTLDIDSPAFGSLSAYIFDSRQLQEANYAVNDIADRLRLQIDVNYDSSEVEHDYTKNFLLSPYIFVAIYDPRMNLSRAVSCGLVTFARVPALASNLFTLSASTMSDPRKYVSSAVDDHDCQKFYTDTLCLQHPPYTTYSFGLGSTMISNQSYCDRHTYPSNASCMTEAILRYDTKIVTSMTTEPGISRTTILLNEGAVVGAVQFFMFFIGMLTL
ncbi:hypothetical protein LTR99_006921 [Exophiala xenobiotica]|uniref:Uncharacterized protein n=1 Tax=Vermiconidia calcicola TaxID=1690605 RepID=A0AAV9Q187_9PEZI|nr:hypothetical protein LTR92_006738 [Exophiala xenobiotica]KAK5531917.1 hypothetical protein LTR25_008247 [Vermiconidia calcicola]KAK5537255.1 hypothetical protein LTR23_007466 [Chaetothyriales sp. CCFEE 6169]KAK5221256.1 hypothetical protein LTR72_006816 [Exophiala xenobiotica]KAK5269487.1 hypothetical protein LTR96_005183 [Exophiala xenobiotica]